MMRRRFDIICISSIDWDFIWQGHQEIMSTLAAQGHRVLFLENTGVRAPQVRDIPRVRQRVRNWWRGTKGFREERPNLFVYSPIVLPLPYSRPGPLGQPRRCCCDRSAAGCARSASTGRSSGPFSRRRSRSTSSALSIPQLADLLLHRRLCVELAAAPGGSSPARSGCSATADLVFVTSEKLRQRAARHSQRVHLFPFGVKFEAFDQVRDEAAAPPADVARLPRPVVGYVGGLHQWVDQDLVAAVAARLPEASIVLVGPEQTDLSSLRAAPNIHLLGMKPHQELPQYVKAFDVGLVPYQLTEYTANVYPTKLNEYLVMGLPVVATDLPEIRRFNQEHGDIVSVAGGADGFAAAVREALRGASPVRTRAARRGRARQQLGEPHRRDDRADGRGARPAREERGAVGDQRCAAPTGRRGGMPRSSCSAWRPCTCWCSRRRCSGGRRSR